MKHLTNRQREIAGLALEIIADHGIQRLTIKSLARAVRVTEPALYRHYKSKFDILMTILTVYKEDLQNLFDQSEKGASSSIEILELLYNSLFSAFIKQPALSAVIFTEDMFRYDRRLSNEVETIIELTHDRIYSILKEGARHGNIRKDIPAKQLAWMVMGTMRILITKWRISRYTLNLTREGKNTMKFLRMLMAIE